MRYLPVPEGGDKKLALANEYLSWAKAAGDTHFGLSCLANARRYFESADAWPQALQTSKQLREQKVNPATAHNYQFDDIYLLAESGDYPKAAAAANRLTTEPKPRWGNTHRTAIGELGRAFAEAKQLAAGLRLGKQLVQMYDATEDKNAADSMIATMIHIANENKPDPRAVPFLRSIIERTEPRDLAYRTATSMAYHSSPVGRYERVLTDYMREIPRAHHIKPDILLRLAEHFLAKRSKKTLTYQGTLRRSYPHSKQRDEIEEKIKRLRERHRNK
jgi:hypothetical protein